MEQHFEKNIQKIVSRVETSFVEKINPYVEKTIRDQKDELIGNILSQVKIDFMKELHGEDNNDQTEITPKGIEVEKYNDYEYRYHLKKGSQYNYEDMKAIKTTFLSNLQNDTDITGDNLTKLIKFMDNLLVDEYLFDVFFYTHRNRVSYLLLITNFGSYFIYKDRKVMQGNYDIEIPRDVLTIFINMLIKPREKDFSLGNFHINNFDYVSFERSIEAFRKYWMLRPFSGYLAECLKKENESIRKKAEEIRVSQDKKMEEERIKTDKQLEESRLEHEKIKHMYEMLELKDQYHKAVELLRQNKIERELLDRDRREFYAEREAARLDLEEKTKKYRQIKDIDTEISRLALVKQKLEKDRRAFEKEKEEFEDLRDSLMD